MQAAPDHNGGQLEARWRRPRRRITCKGHVALLPFCCKLTPRCKALFDSGTTRTAGTWCAVTAAADWAAGVWGEGTGRARTGLWRIGGFATDWGHWPPPPTLRSGGARARIRLKAGPGRQFLSHKASSQLLTLAHAGQGTSSKQLTESWRAHAQCCLMSAF
jgi:hypothetical protein